MALPTRGEKFAELIEHLRKAQEAAIVLGHLVSDEDKLQYRGWLAIGELLNELVLKVTDLAKRGMH